MVKGAGTLGIDMNTSSRVVLSLVLLGVGVAAGWYALQFLSGATQSAGQAPAVSSPASAPGGAPRGVPVELAVAESVSFPRGISAIGTLRSDESTVISAEVAGRVAQINFEEGQPVAAAIG